MVWSVLEPPETNLYKFPKRALRILLCVQNDICKLHRLDWPVVGLSRLLFNFLKGKRLFVFGVAEDFLESRISKVGLNLAFVIVACNKHVVLVILVVWGLVDNSFASQSFDVTRLTNVEIATRIAAWVKV